MTTDNANGHALNAATVMLVLADQSALDYLQNILQFIDCDVHVPESPDELKRMVQRFNDRSSSVFLSGQLPDQERSAYLSAINECNPRPALIQIQEKTGNEMLVSGDVLGTLRLPCQ